MTKLTRAVTALAAAAIALGAIGCTAQPPAADGERTLTLGIGSAGPFDIRAGGIDFALGQTVLDSLIISIGEDEFMPQLAEDFGYKDDGKVLWFTIRQGVTFTDGVELNAAVIKEVFDDYIANSAIAGGYFHAVTSIEVTGDYDVQFNLSQFDDSVLFHLGEIGVMSPNSLDDPEASANPVGTGAYILDKEKTVIDSEYVLTKNEDAWQADAFPWDTLVFKVIPDATARLNALKSGQIDYGYIDVPMVTEAENSGLEIFNQDILWNGLLLDPKGVGNAAIADPRVREAIAYAFDRDAIAEALYPGLDSSTNQPGQPGTSFYREDLADKYAFDPDKAKELLAEAGYPDGFDLVLASFVGNESTVEPVITQALSDIGIRVTYEYYSDLDGFLAGAPNQAVTVFTNCSCVLVSAQLQPGAIFDIYKYSDPKLADLLAVLQDGTATKEDRDAARAGITEFLLDSNWIITYSRMAQPIAHTADVVIDENLMVTVPQLMTLRSANE